MKRKWTATIITTSNKVNEVVSNYSASQQKYSLQNRLWIRPLKTTLSGLTMIQQPTIKTSSRLEFSLHFFPRTRFTTKFLVQSTKLSLLEAHLKSIAAILSEGGNTGKRFRREFLIKLVWEPLCLMEASEFLSINGTAKATSKWTDKIIITLSDKLFNLRRFNDDLFN